MDQKDESINSLRGENVRLEKELIACRAEAILLEGKKNELSAAYDGCKEHLEIVRSEKTEVESRLESLQRDLETNIQTRTKLEERVGDLAQQVIIANWRAFKMQFFAVAVRRLAVGSASS